MQLSSIKPSKLFLLFFLLISIFLSFNFVNSQYFSLTPLTCSALLSNASFSNNQVSETYVSTGSLFVGNATCYSNPINLKTQEISNINSMYYFWTEAPGFYSNGSDIPLADYHFENNTQDDTSYANNIVTQSASPPTYQTNCQIGGCYNFNGSNFFTMPNYTLEVHNSSFNAYKTIVAWFKTSSDGIIIGTTTSYYPTAGSNWDIPLYVGTDGYLHGGYYSAQLKSKITVNDNNWHQGVLAYNSSGEYLYLDGVLQSNGATPTISNDDVAYIGSGYSSTVWPNTNNNWFFFNGSIDEVSVWNRTLNSTEISQLYGWQDQGQFIHNYTTANLSYRILNYTFNSANLQGWWNLGDSQNLNYSNPISFDLSGNSNNFIFSTNNSPSIINSNCILSSCLNFSQSDFLYLTSSLENPNVTDNSNLTFSIWFNTNSTGGVILSYLSSHYPNIPQNGYDNLFYINNSGYLHAGFIPSNLYSNLVSTSAVNNGKWHQAVLTISNNNNQSLYLDGYYVSSLSDTLSVSSLENQLILGEGYGTNWVGLNSGFDGFNGYLNDLKIWNRTLKISEISSLYNSGNPTGTNGLEQNWQYFNSSAFSNGMLNFSSYAPSIFQFYANLSATSLN